MARRHLHPDFLTRDVGTRWVFECSKCGRRHRRAELDLWRVDDCLGCGRHIARTINENRRALGLPALPAPDGLLGQETVERIKEELAKESPLIMWAKAFADMKRGGENCD